MAREATSLFCLFCLLCWSVTLQDSSTIPAAEETSSTQRAPPATAEGTSSEFVTDGPSTPEPREVTPPAAAGTVDRTSAAELAGGTSAPTSVNASRATSGATASKAGPGGSTPGVTSPDETDPWNRTSVATVTLTRSNQTSPLVTSKEEEAPGNATVTITAATIAPSSASSAAASNFTVPATVAGEATGNVTSPPVTDSADTTKLLANNSSSFSTATVTAAPTLPPRPTNATHEADTNETATGNPETSATVWPGNGSQPSAATLQPPDHCKGAKVTCPPDSKCQNLYLSFTCLCPPGFVYSSNISCVTARTFPGTLHLKNKKFSEAMKRKNSKEFHSLASKIQNLMKNVFGDEPYYLKSAVQKLEKGSVQVHMDNLFGIQSKVTADAIHRKITDFIKNCTDCGPLTIGDLYTSKSICNGNICDPNTTQCRNNDGLASCDCLSGYYKFTSSDRSCKACTSGFKLVDGICVKCPFGYGGFNCDESSLLAVVVISCVLGSLLLLLILIAACLWCKKSPSNSSSSSQDYVMWPKTDVPKIPRVTMHWESHQLEMQENGSTNSLTDSGRTAEKTEDLKTFKGKQPSRYTYLCQGQENPYYISDEKKSEYL